MTMLRVPEETKEKVEGLKDRFHAKTSYEVTEKLIRSMESFDNFKDQIRQEKAEAKEREGRELLDVGEQVKFEFGILKAELNIRNDADFLSFLMMHYKESNSFDKITMQYLRNLK